MDNHEAQAALVIALREPHRGKRKKKKVIQYSGFACCSEWQAQMEQKQIKHLKNFLINL
jgi:hypothetical protein